MFEIDMRNKTDVVYSLKSCHNDISTNIMDEVY